MKSEKKQNKKKKLIAGLVGIVIVLGFILYGVVKTAYAEWDTVTWSGTFANPTKPWTYSTTSYAYVWCDESGNEPVKINANEGNGFTRKEDNSTNVINLKMVEDELFNYLGWDLEYGNTIWWQADANVSVRYGINGKKLAERTYPSVSGNKWTPYEASVVFADGINRDVVKRSMKNAISDINFTDWSDTGSLFFVLTDTTGAHYGLCHSFDNNHYVWGQLTNEDKIVYQPIADFIIRFTDENGNEIIPPNEKDYLEIPQGQGSFTYDEAKEELEVNGTKYKLKEWTCKGSDNSTVKGTTATATIANEIKKKHYRMEYTITFVYTADEHKVTVNYETEDGELIYTKEDTVADGKDYTYTADKVFTKDDTVYEYQDKATWSMGTAMGTASSTIITVRECTEDVTITCIYKETKDHLVTIDYVTEDGVLFDSFSDTVKDEEDYSYTAKSSIASGDYTYTFKEALWEMGTRSGTSGANIKITDCTEDIYITCVYSESGGGGDCDHEFGPWITVTSGADGTCSRTCILCGYETPAEKHREVLTSQEILGRDEATGTVTKKETYTCEKEEGGCGDTWTNIVHPHECVVIEWLPDEPSAEWWLEYQEAIKSGSTYADFGYWRDPDKQHWRYCQYSDCPYGRERGPEGHVWESEYVDEGDGYLVRRCKKCRWIRDLKPVVVNLTLDPMGGTFPNGSSETITFPDIEYGSIVDLGTLGSEYFPEKESMTFTGYAYFTYNDEGYMYTPNQETKTMTASSKFFTDLGNGKYKSNLKKDWIIYAQWKAAEYEVVYHADNDFADGSTTTSYHKVGTPQKLSPNYYYSISNITYADGGNPCQVESTLANTMVKADFIGWNKTSGRDDFRKYAAGEKTDFADEEEVLDLLKTSGVVNLYGVWDYGKITLPNAKSTDDGYKLSAWITEEGTRYSVLDDSGNFDNDVTYVIKGGDETLTAEWEPNEYTVTFDTDGADSGDKCEPITVTYKKKFGPLPVPEKTGHIFIDWVWKVTNEVITEDSVAEYAVNYELLAKWEKKPVTVTFDYNFDYGTAENTQKKPQISYTTKHGEKVDKFDGVDDFTEVDSNTDKMMFAYDSYYGKLPKPTRDGYTFAGWYFEEDGEGNGCGEQACLLTESGSRITNPDDHTIYARWIPETTKVNLDYNREHSVWED